MIESHLTEQQIEAYRRRALDAVERGAFDRHLAGCDACLRKVIDAAHAHIAFTALAESLLPRAGEAPFHLSFEELKRYAAGQLDQADSVIFESHLADCAECNAEARQLVLIGTSQPEGEKVKPLWEKFKDSWWRPPSFYPAYVGGIALACVIVLLGILWIQSRRAGRSDQPALSQIANNGGAQKRSIVPSANDSVHPQPIESGRSIDRKTNATTLVKLIDGSRTVTLESDGAIRGLDGLEVSIRAEVTAALSPKGLKKPDSLAALTAPSINLLDPSSKTAAFTLLGPTRIVIADDHPKFRWEPLKGASNYTVSVFDSNFNLVVRSASQTTTEWSPSQPLDRGQIYSWEVKALKDGQEIVSPVAPAPRSQFKIIDGEKLEQINRVKRERPDSHLVLGILYARAGLLEDAKRELQLIVNANPDSPVARRLLQRVQSWERHGR